MEYLCFACGGLAFLIVLVFKVRQHNTNGRFGKQE